MPKWLACGHGLAVHQSFIGRSGDRKNDPLPACVALKHALLVIPKLAIGAKLARQRIAKFSAYTDLNGAPVWAA